MMQQRLCSPSISGRYIVSADLSHTYIHTYCTFITKARGEYREAFFLFKDSFNSYNAFGSPRRLILLKYMILTSMMNTDNTALNVFGEQDTAAYVHYCMRHSLDQYIFSPSLSLSAWVSNKKCCSASFQHDPEVRPMAELLVAYEKNDVLRCERIISEHKAVIMCDDFIKSHIASMLYTVRGQVLLKLVDPYSRIRISSLAKVCCVNTQLHRPDRFSPTDLNLLSTRLQLLNISEEDVEDLIVAMILDNKIQGKLDQIQHVLLIDPPLYVVPATV
jgi:hypothetical protein